MCVPSEVWEYLALSSNLPELLGDASVLSASSEWCHRLRIRLLEKLLCPVKASEFANLTLGEGGVTLGFTGERTKGPMKKQIPDSTRKLVCKMFSLFPISQWFGARWFIMEEVEWDGWPSLRISQSSIQAVSHRINQVIVKFASFGQGP
ncbi:uncharacterized protein G2W53_008036 [Senna tora]|uniref:Uncharacterized protein n=1 Tax=Senna tora TaxID=362788 RepID=A0A834X8L0_9FABA|nr:uncharacterized protein G2W53_008036 [Senna tora]